MLVANDIGTKQFLLRKQNGCHFCLQPSSTLQTVYIQNASKYDQEIPQ